MTNTHIDDRLICRLLEIAVEADSGELQNKISRDCCMARRWWLLRTSCGSVVRGQTHLHRAGHQHSESLLGAWTGSMVLCLRHTELSLGNQQSNARIVGRVNLL